MQIELDKEFFYRIANETPAELHTKFNTSKNNVLRNNENINFYSGEIVKIKTNDYLTHIVKPAENIKTICEKYNIDEQTLLDNNNLESAHLFIGQTLKIKK